MTSFVEKAKKRNKGAIVTIGGTMKTYHIDSIFDEMIEDVKYIELVDTVLKIDRKLSNLLP